MSLIKNLIYITVFLLPFIFFPKIFYPLVFSKFIFFEFMFLSISLVYILNIIYGKVDFYIKNKKLILFFLLYLISISISTIFAFIPNISFWGGIDQGTGLLFMWSLFFFALVVSNVFRSKEDWYKLFSVFSVSGIFFTILSLIGQAGFKFTKLLELNNFSGFLIGNSSWTGIYISFVFFISLGLFFASKVKYQKIIGLLGMVVSFFDPILTGFILQAPGASFGPIGLARASSYSLWFCIILFLLYIIFQKIKIERYRKIFIGVFLSLSLIVAIFSATFGRVEIKDFIIKNAGPNRLVYWDIGIQGLKERPVFGWGMESYQYVYTKYFNPIIKTEGYAPEYWVDRAHNIYVDELVTSGALGLLLLVSIYIILGYYLIYKSVKDESKDKYLYITLFLGLVSFLIQGIMIFQVLIGWFIIGLLISFVITDNNDLSLKMFYRNIKYKGFISFVLILSFVFFMNSIVFRPFNFAHNLASFPTKKYTERIVFYKSIPEFYMGNLSDLGSAFLPHHSRLRDVLLRENLNSEQKELMVKEIGEMNVFMKDSLLKQKYMDFKSLTALIALNSIAIAISDGDIKDFYKNESLMYIEKMKEVSPENPIIISSENLINYSFIKGEESIGVLNKK